MNQFRYPQSYKLLDRHSTWLFFSLVSMRYLDLCLKKFKIQKFKSDWNWVTITYTECVLFSQLAAAKAWTNWEMATSYLVPNDESLKRGENEKFALVRHFSPRSCFSSLTDWVNKLLPNTNLAVIFLIIKRCEWSGDYRWYPSANSTTFTKFFFWLGICCRPLHELKIITFGTRVFSEPILSS